VRVDRFGIMEPLEIFQLVAAVREEMRREGLISEAEHMFTRLEKLNLTKARREDAIPYVPSLVSSAA
jgi:hypothetical protein